ncbi:MAG: phosphoribosylaminoimidazolesuccinocarboxamide synthase [Candidatus Moraniibacteriota bacterium]
MNEAVLFESSIQSLPLVHRGKVRDTYAISDELLLIVTTDRLSAFDVVLDDPIPGKGEVLTALSNFWFWKFGHLTPHHMTSIDPTAVVSGESERAQVRGRAVVAKKLKSLPIEAIVRGYLIGSGWKDYQKTGAVCGITLPSGLRQAEKLPKVLFTPSTKAPAGQHDENISFEQTEKLIGVTMAWRIRDTARALYIHAAAYAAARGIIIADTKFEFGIDADGKLCLIDEVLTPDSSRFWPVEEYRIGTSPPSYDKQFVRDWLETQPWDKKAPAPRLPYEIIAKTAEKYHQALTRLAVDE